jgi:ubiquitin-conjugating enzyme E2 variant
VRFTSRVNLTCVDQNTGAVEARGVSVLANWNRGYNLERLLQELRREMCSAQNRRNVSSRPQPRRSSPCSRPWPRRTLLAY